MATGFGFKDSRLQGTALLGSLLAGSVALVLLRAMWTQSGHYLFLLWNLFLAVVPLLASTLLRRAAERRSADLMQLALLAVWLLFLPNAPYILTDLVHLNPDGSRLYWYDLGMVLSCAGTGLLLGYASLFEVHGLFEQRFGERFGWSVALVALLASGYGVYLGRVQRWNSWDVVTNPQGLLMSILDTALHPAQHLHVYASSGLFGVGLVAGYATLHIMRGARSPQTVGTQ
jgi:uncharacterized membrane protein